MISALPKVKDGEEFANPQVSLSNYLSALRILSVEAMNDIFRQSPRGQSTV
jgi:hypothetical protein